MIGWKSGTSFLSQSSSILNAKPITFQHSINWTLLYWQQRHSPEVSDLQVSILGMHLHVILPEQVFPGNFAIGINKKMLLSVCPSDKQLSSFACPGQVFCFDLLGRQLALALAHWATENKRLFFQQQNLVILDIRTAIFSSNVSTLSTRIKTFSYLTISREQCLLHISLE